MNHRLSGPSSHGAGSTGGHILSLWSLDRVRVAETGKDRWHQGVGQWEMWGGERRCAWSLGNISSGECL